MKNRLTRNGYNIEYLFNTEYNTNKVFNAFHSIILKQIEDGQLYYTRRTDFNAPYSLKVSNLSLNRGHNPSDAH